MRAPLAPCVTSGSRPRSTRTTLSIKTAKMTGDLYFQPCRRRHVRHVERGQEKGYEKVKPHLENKVQGSQSISIGPRKRDTTPGELPRNTIPFRPSPLRLSLSRPPSNLAGKIVAWPCKF
eukprot:1394890-Amorphochlora_amoeboformis.AAC.1